MSRIIDLDELLTLFENHAATIRQESVGARTARESVRYSGYLQAMAEARAIAGRIARESATDPTPAPIAPESPASVPASGPRECPVDTFATANMAYRVPTGPDGRKIPVSTVYRAESCGRFNSGWIYLVKKTDGVWYYESSYISSPIVVSRTDVLGMLRVLRDLAHAGEFRLNVYMRAVW